MGNWKKRTACLSVTLLLAAASSVLAGGAAGLADAADQVKVNAPAPDFSLPDLGGREVSLSGLKGKAVLVAFWSLYCAPCRQELPAIDAAYRKNKEKGLEVVGVCIDRDPIESIQDFVKTHQLTFPILLDRERKVMKVYRAHFLPTAYALSRSGKVIDKKVGLFDWAGPEGQKQVEELLKKK